MLAPALESTSALPRVNVFPPVSRPRKEPVVKPPVDELSRESVTIVAAENWPPPPTAKTAVAPDLTTKLAVVRLEGRARALANTKAPALMVVPPE